MTIDGRHHKQSLTNGGVHGVVSFEYPNAAARLSASGFDDNDIYKFAIDLDTGNVNILTGISPSMWVEVASALPEMLGGDLDGYMPNPIVINLSIPGQTSGSVLYFDGSQWQPLAAGQDGYVLHSNGPGLAPTWEPDATSTGNVTGPGSSTDSAVVLFDGVTGKVIKNSLVTVSSGGVITVSPTTPTAPFVLSANAQSQLVVGLNADQLNGQSGAYYQDAGNLNAGTLLGDRFDDASHGSRSGGALHSNATISVAGFMSAADKLKVDNYPANLDGYALKAITLTAGSGLTGGGDLSANRTFAVGANGDGSIVVNADDIQVGILATDAQHGVRGGGTQHATATTSAAGFMSASDKIKLNGLVADGYVVGPASSTDEAIARFDLATGKLIQNSNATLTDGGVLGLNPTTATPAIVLNANAQGQLVVGLNADLLDSQSGSFYQDAGNLNAGTLPAARFNDTTHGARAGGTLHADVTTSTSGFMSASDKIKLNGLVADGYVIGPASSTDEALARFDLATGKLIQNSNATLSDGGVLSLNPTTATPPIILSANGQGQLVVGLNADLLDSQSGAFYQDAGNLNAGILPAARFNDTSHGARAGGTLHADVTTSTSGFMSASDKIKLNSYPISLDGYALSSRTITAGAGLTGGGDLSANRTFDVVANADGSIVVNANDLQVGVLATDAQHGVRGGGTVHATATTSVAGFMSASDKIKLNSYPTSLDGYISNPGNTQGSILYNNGSGWVALGPSTDGYVLTTNGIGFNPAWEAPTGSGSSTSAGYSVKGKATSGSGTTTDIVYGTDELLRRSGSGDITSGKVEPAIINSVYDVDASTSGSFALTYGTSAARQVNLSGNATFSSIVLPAAGMYALKIVNSGAYTLSWPVGIVWSNGVAPTLTASATSVFSLRYDGTNIYGSYYPKFGSTAGTFTEGNAAVSGDLDGYLPSPTVRDLTISGEQQGSILYRNATNWVALAPGDDGYVLTANGIGFNPAWEVPTGSGSSTSAGYSVRGKATSGSGTTGDLIYGSDELLRRSGSANVTSGKAEPAHLNNIYDIDGYTSGTFSIAFTTSGSRQINLGGNATISAITFPAAGKYTLKIVNSGSYTFGWPVSIIWPNGGTAPTVSVSATDYYTLSYDGYNTYGTYYPKFGTTAGTFAQGNDSRFALGIQNLGNVLNTGNTTDGYNVVMSSGSSIITAAASGLPITITAGTGATTGGLVAITGGQGAASSAGGAVTITSGAGGATTGTGGTISLIGGNVTGAGSASNGGSINITTGNAGTSTGTGIGGTLTLTAGNGGSTSGNAGSVNIVGGTSSVVGTGAQIRYDSTGVISITSAAILGTNTGRALTLTAGLGGATSGAGGIASLLGGAAATSGAGGAANITGGTGIASGGGAVNITGGTPGTTNTGGAVILTSGAGGSTSGASGAVTITSGTTTSGAGGVISGTVGNSTGNNTGSNITWTAGQGGTTDNTGGIFSGAGGAGGTTNGAGGISRLIGGASAGSGTGGAAQLTGGAGGTTGNGGAVTITSGAGGSTSGNAGTISLLGGTSAGNQGGAIIITGGPSFTGSGGGPVTITGGIAGSTNTGGAVNVVAGAGGSTSGAGGILTLASGAPTTSGGGGAINITGKNALVSGLGTTITLTAGNSLGSNAGGAIAGTAGTAATSNTGGAVTWTAGASGTTGTGGAFAAVGGAGGTTSGIGGVGSVTGGAGGGSGTGGAAQLVGGAGGLTGAGGAVTITGGAGGGTSGNGGSIIITPGAVTSGTVGSIRERLSTSGMTWNVDDGTNVVTSISRNGVITVSPQSTAAPFVLGANALGQLVTGLNADLLDGYTSSDFLRITGGDGYISGNFHIAGKLSVDGLIDPTGLVLVEQVSKPISGTATTGVVWVRDDGYLVFTNQNNTDTVLGSGGGGGGSGDVAGPSSATANAIALFNGTGGKTIKNSTVTIDSNSAVTGVQRIGFGSEINDGYVSGSTTIDFTTGSIKKLTLSGNTTVTSITTPNIGFYYLTVTNTDGYTLTLPSTLLWPNGGQPIITTNGTDMITLFYNGTNVKCQWAPNFQIGNNTFNGLVKGSAVLDFGPYPGNSNIDLVVTDGYFIGATSRISLRFSPTATVTHTVDEHIIASMCTTLFAKDIVPGVGFTITAASEIPLTGIFNVQWEYQ